MKSTTAKQLQPGLTSFLCLSYNHASFLSRCVESIWEQQSDQIEIIALDDGSSDDSQELLQSLAQSSPCPMKVILQQNSGNVAKNFNTLIEAASGQYLFMTSMDDYFEPDALSSKLPFFENDPNMCFVSNLVKNTVDHNGKILDRKIPLIEWDQINGGDVERLIAGTHELVTLVALQGSMLRTRDILAIGGFDEDLLGDDVVLYTKLFFYMQERPELNFKMLDTVAINYRLHQNNISKNDLRMAEMTVEWRNRYFADRPIPNRLLLSLKLWVASTLIHKKPEQATGFIKHFRSLLKDETAKTKEQSIAFLLGATDKRCRYLIPFFFEVKKRKTILTSRFSFIFLGFKAAELISERYAGRSYTKIILFKYLNFTFLHKR